MPELSFFYGIKITMHFEASTPHRKPHFHASCGEHEAVYSTKGELLAGELPPRQTKLIAA